MGEKVSTRGGLVKVMSIVWSLILMDKGGPLVMRGTIGLSLVHSGNVSPSTTSHRMERGLGEPADGSNT